MKKRKLLAVFLALVMTLSLLPTTALAADEPITNEAELREAMVAGGNITLGADLSLAESIVLNGAVTTNVDLNGQTLTLPQKTIGVKNGAKLTFSNGNISATASSANAAVISVEAGSSVTLDQVVYTTNGAALYPKGNAAEVRVIESEITAGAYAVATNAAAVDNYNVQIDLKDSEFSAWSAVFINVPGTLKMTNCEVNASMHGVVVRGGTANIQDCVITQNYPDDDAADMANYFNSRNWGSGNMLNLAAMTIGNKVDGAYNYPTNVTLTNTKLITAGDNAGLFPALYSWANTGDGKGVTFESDADCEFDGDICFGDDARNTSATFNGGSFTDLSDAAKYSAAGSMIYLLKDVSYMEAEANIIVDMRGKTLDLNQHTITNNNYSTHNALIFDGEDFTIQNGTFYAPGDYALWIGENGADGVTVDGITTEGGINIYNSVNVTLKNTEVDAAEKTYYAVWCDEGAFATIESGSYSSGGVAVVGLAERYDSALDTPIAGLSIKGGTFTAVGSADLVLEGEKRDKPVITGGTFSVDPIDYVASDYHVVEADSKFTVHEIVEEEHAAVAATCTTDGNVAYYTCSGCGADVYYSDAECANRLDEVVLPALGHDFAEAWTTNADKHWHDCSRCDVVSGEAAHTFEKTGIVGGAYEWTCSVCGYSKTGAADAHAIDTTKVTNGTVVAKPNPATVGQSVKLTLTPKDGYNDADVQIYYSYNDVVNAELSSLTFTMPDAAVTITGTFKPIEYQITYNLDGGTQSASNPNPIKYTVESDTITLSAPTRSGYTFLGWTYEGQTAPSKNVTIPTGSIGDKTFTANWSYNGGGSTGGGGGSSSGGSSTSTTTEKNPDGSTTTTTTDKTTGTVTETTKNTDGSTTTVETKKDGTVTETNKAADGTTGTVVTDKNGDVTEAKATVSTEAATEAAKSGEAVTLPVEVPAAKTTEDAPAVQVSVPKSAGSVKVEVPVEKVTPGTVAVIVNADGTEKIVSTSVVTENGVALTLEGNATVKVIDNSKTFTDVPETNVFYNEISSLSAREIMVGKTEDTFDLHNDVTLNQVANVAGRITGEVDVKDFNAGIVWGNENGLKTGNEAATRGEVLKALYVAAGSPAVADTSVLARFNDAASIPADMAAIVAWAAQNDILKGTDAGNADLNVYVTRGQACALASRTMSTLA